jgi:peptidoglycan hydrolase CwlO-like protein
MIKRAIEKKEKQVDSLKDQLKILKGNGSGNEEKIAAIEQNLEGLKKDISNLKRRLPKTKPSTKPKKKGD